MEDAIALAAALDDTYPDVTGALAEFEARRRPEVEKLLSAAAGSYEWYESFHLRMGLDAHSLAYDYMTRSGRVSPARLREIAPRFMASVDQRSGRTLASHPRE